MYNMLLKSSLPVPNKIRRDVKNGLEYQVVSMLPYPKGLAYTPKFLAYTPIDLHLV